MQDLILSIKNNDIESFKKCEINENNIVICLNKIMKINNLDFFQDFIERAKIENYFEICVKCIKSNKITYIKYLLEKFNFQKEVIDTLVEYCLILTNNKKILDLLIEYGGEVKIKFILNSFINYSPSYFKYVISLCKDLEEQESFENITKIILTSSILNRKDIVELMLNKNFIIDMTSISFEYIMKLFANNNNEIIKLIITHSKNITTEYFLQSAVVYNNLEIVKFLVEKGVKINDHNVYFALNSEYLDISNYLLDFYIDKRKFNDYL